jgi:acyl carrier protein
MELNSKLRTFLIKCLEDAIDEETVNPEKDFALLGLDSITVFEFTSQLRQAIPDVPLTIFLECKNFKELQKYLLLNHNDELTTYFSKT